MDNVSKSALDDAAFQNLHRRAVMGETLSAMERQAYEARLQELDGEERLDGDLDLLRTLRVEIVAAEREQQRLREKEAELDARIAALEAQLDGRTRTLLGIGN